MNKLLAEGRDKVSDLVNGRCASGIDTPTRTEAVAALWKLLCANRRGQGSYAHANVLALYSNTSFYFPP